jgi:hypothetical protein
MEEFLSQLLLALAELLFEALLEFGGGALLDLLSRTAAEVFEPAEPPNTILTGLVCGFMGAAVGALSLVILPHPLFHRTRFHGISLIISPFAAGMAMSAVGAMHRRRGKSVVQIENFPYAFTFALCMALVRLVWAA